MGQRQLGLTLISPNIELQYLPFISIVMLRCTQRQYLKMSANYYLETSTAFRSQIFKFVLFNIYYSNFKSKNRLQDRSTQDVNTSGFVTH